MEGSDAELLAAGSDVLGSQHGSVGRGFVTVGLDLHASCYTSDCFAATSITVSPQSRSQTSLERERQIASLLVLYHTPEICNVDEGIVEAGVDTSNTENKFTFPDLQTIAKLERGHRNRA